jgi:uncharacterized membrane protein
MDGEARSTDASETGYLAYEEAIVVTTEPAVQAMETAPLTVIGSFDGMTSAERALQELKDAGFSRDQISLVARSDSTVSTVDGHTTTRDAEIGAGGIGVLGGVAGWLLGISALAIPGIGPVVGIGILWTTLVGAGIGAAAGGLGGALIGHNVDESHARGYEEQVRSGSALVTVHMADREQQERARTILERAGGVDVRPYGTLPD